MDARLPANLYARPVTLQDLEACVDLFNAYARSLIGQNQLSIASVRDEWTGPFLNLANDTIAIFNSDGKPVAYSEFWDYGDPHVRFYTYNPVHPDYQGCGLGSFLLDWQVAHAQKNLLLAPSDARVILQQFLISPNEPANRLLSQRGFALVRHSYTMEIAFDAPPEPPEPIDGIVIRSITNDEEQRGALFADYEAFRDHWGMVQEPFEQFYQRNLEALQHDHRYDPSLCFIALDGNEVAGLSLCLDHTDEDPQRGWVGSLGVRRAWRKRGLGLALLRHSFFELHRLGKSKVGLGVDAENLTGALRLYERAGMHPVRQYNMYQLELRAGKEYTTTSLEE